VLRVVKSQAPCVDFSATLGSRWELRQRDSTSYSTRTCSNASQDEYIIDELKKALASRVCSAYGSVQARTSTPRRTSLSSAVMGALWGTNMHQIDSFPGSLGDARGVPALQTLAEGQRPADAPCPPHLIACIHVNPRLRPPPKHGHQRAPTT
jgi:hypothetical protein